MTDTFWVANNNKRVSYDDNYEHLVNDETFMIDRRYLTGIPSLTREINRVA